MQSGKTGEGDTAPGGEEVGAVEPASAAKRLAMLEVMLAQAGKFSEFVNASLGDGKSQEGAASENVSGDADDPAAAAPRAKIARRKSEEDVAATSAPAAQRQPKLLSGGTLRKYQLEGYTWLSKLYENGINGILADEMGLGKTIQVIALMAHLREMAVEGPMLVVGPLTTVPNWIAEFNRFAPTLSTMLYHGTIAERGELRSAFASTDVVVTSYEIAIRDRPFLARHEWLYLVVDEGHRLKNMDCRLVRDLKTLQCQNRLLLTGTPLQNDLKELFSLLNFLLPFIFTDVSTFTSMFDFRRLNDAGASDDVIEKQVRHRIVSKLHEIVRPFLLRRVKSEVDVRVPPKAEVVVYAGMTKVQRELYHAITEKRLRRKLQELGWAEHGVEGHTEFKQSFQNELMQLRKCTNHPFLFGEPVRADGDHHTDERLVQVSGKMAVFDKLIRGLTQRGHRVLVFSQMTKMLDIIEDFLRLRRIQSCRIDGSTAWRERQAAIDEFNSNPQVGCFLLSTRAGGLGINLTAADTVVLFDSDWNPHQDSQAQDRCHRIGQTRPVVVYRLITRDSVETELLAVANGKRKLETLVIARGKFRSRHAVKELTEGELRKLLASAEVKATRKAPTGIADVELNALLERDAVMKAAHATSSTSSSTPASSPGPPRRRSPRSPSPSPSSPSPPRRRKRSRTPRTVDVRATGDGYYFVMHTATSGLLA